MTMRKILIPLLALAMPCWAQSSAQVMPASGACALYPISSQTNGENIWITWASPACEVAKAHVFRRKQGIGKEAEIHPVLLIGDRNDSTLVICADPLFTELGIYEYRVVPVDSTGKKGPSSPWTIGHNLYGDISPWAYAIRVQDMPEERSLRLQWALKFPERVRGVVIHRAENFDGPYLHLADVGPEDSTYIDLVERVKEVYFYRIEVIDVVGLSSVSMPVQGLTDAEPPVSPPIGLVARAEPHGITLYWPYDSPDVSHYKVERNNPDEEKWVLVADGIRAPAETSLQWTDSSATDNKVRRYRVRAVSFGGPISDPSNVETKQALDSSVPSTPTDVAVRRVDEHTVVISWRDIWAGDIGAYQANVERADTGNTEFTVLNKEPLKAGYTVFHDSTAIPGKPYTYRVVGLTVSGTQGIPSMPAVLKVKDARTTGPRMLMAHRQAKGIAVEWAEQQRQGTDFNLYRALDDGELKLLKVLPIDASSYLDEAIVDGALHLYVIALVLPDGSETNPSEPVSVRW